MLADQLTLHQRDDLPDDVIDVERDLLNAGLVRERPDAPDHLTRPISVVYYPFHRAAHCIQVGSFAVEPPQTGLRVGDDGGERLVHFMGDGGCQLAQHRHARYVCKLHLRLAQGFRGEHMFGKVSADREHGLHPLRGRPQRRIGCREVAPANRLVEPLCVTDLLSRETAVEVRLGRLLKVLPSQKLGYVLPDERLGWHTPSPLEGWVHPLKPVVWSDDGYAIG